ncbi:MAG: tRNA pseudouridine(38-40) synthase TruA [Oscillospiraceae bacterium]|nr:tRNA pseudouridine(38-40) synthase TruA [Oscillospiraceae bacterium]
MRNLAVKIQFIGKNYHGFQRQDNAVSVQGEIEEALFKILGEKISIIGCSRTDTGVSAKEYVFNFKTNSDITPFKLMGALNYYLSEDIGVLDAVEVEENFHARYSCVKKEYIYIIRNARGRSPFVNNTALSYMISELDAESLNCEAQDLVGTYDFSSFCSLHDSAKSHIRTIYSAEVKREGENVIFKFCADGFLYNMVRIMVGTLLFINEGKINKGQIKNIIEAKNRKCAGATAEGVGLILNRVYYQNEIFKEGEN